MPALKTYDLFLSHAWKYNNDYYNLENLLRNAAYFKWRNYSVPVHNPLIDPNTWIGRSKLSTMLDHQIRPVNCFLLIAGMYSLYSYWIESEIEIAKSYNKPIIAISPYGQQRMPLAIRKAADTIVGWRTISIVDAVRHYSL